MTPDNLARLEAKALWLKCVKQLKFHLWQKSFITKILLIFHPVYLQILRPKLTVLIMI
jgi:hypothetical protein